MKRLQLADREQEQNASDHRPDAEDSFADQTEHNPHLDLAVLHSRRHADGLRDRPPDGGRLVGLRQPGGAFTDALLAVLRGETFVQSHWPYLAVTDIGPGLRPEVGPDDQTVSTWVLNLQGPNRFVRNPHFDEHSHRSDAVTATFAMRVRAEPSAADVAEIKATMLTITENVDEIALSALLERISKPLSELDRVPLLLGLAMGMADAARRSEDHFGEGRVLSVFLGQLLPPLKSGMLGADEFATLANRAIEADLVALRNVSKRLQEHEYALVSKKSGLADLFFLPLRLSDILGRIGAQLFAGAGATETAELRDLTNEILRGYGGSLVAMCEEQATGMLVFLSACCERCWIEEAEETIGYLYSDLIKNFGLVGKHFLTGEQALRLLQESYTLRNKFDGQLYQSPSDLATVIILFGSILNLDETIDRSLILIDHTCLNFFVPEDASSIGLVGPVPGQNIGYTIGHGVWSCADVRREWGGPLLGQITRDALGSNSSELLGGMLASLALRDRVFWLPVPHAVRALSARSQRISFIER